MTARHDLSALSWLANMACIYLSLCLFLISPSPSFYLNNSHCPPLASTFPGSSEQPSSKSKLSTYSIMSKPIATGKSNGTPAKTPLATDDHEESRPRSLTAKLDHHQSRDRTGSVPRIERSTCLLYRSESPLTSYYQQLLTPTRPTARWATKTQSTSPSSLSRLSVMKVSC